MYEATDGSRWNTVEECGRRDSMHAETILAELPLGRRVNLDWNEYVAHSVSDVEKVKDQYKVMAVKHFGTANGRVTTDMENPIGSLFNRLSCIDAKGREWQQPYYTNYTPENPKQVIVH